VQAYESGHDGALRFFPGDPRAPEAYRSKAAEVDGRFDRAARERAATLASSPTDAAEERMRRVVSEDGVLVTTGQQPGLFGGPLYSIYKGLTAVRLADALETVLDRPVAPLFWIASDDHDWEEANHTWVVDLENELRRIALPDEPPVPGEPPLHRISLEGVLEDPYDQLTQALPDTDFSSDYLELIRDAYGGVATLPGAFRTLLERLLGPFGLSFVEAHDAGLKEASLPALLREIDGAGEHEALLRDRARALEDAGFGVQVPILEGAVNLFLEGPEGRERIYRTGEGFRLHRSDQELTREELAERVESEPLILSPNVLLRPVVETVVFPTVAYVAGPGEIAYFAQLPDLFEAHGASSPVVVPRTSLTIVEGKNGKVLEKFGLELADLDRPFHELASEVAREEVPPEVQRALGELRGAIGEKSGALLQVAREIDPTLKGPITHARNTAFGELEEVEKKITQALKREKEIALAQLEKAQAHLFPLGKPQERVLNVFYYLVRYGPDFLPAVADRCSVEFGSDPA